MAAASDDPGDTLLQGRQHLGCGVIAGPGSSGRSRSASLSACKAPCKCCPCGPQNGCWHSGPPANALSLTAAAAANAPSATSCGVGTMPEPLRRAGGTAWAAVHGSSRGMHMV